MLFSSPEFFLFFAIYFALHLATPPRFRIYLIIFGSSIFYAWWKVQYLWLPYALMAIAYWGSFWIDRTREAISRRRRTVVTILILFLPLLIFKYTDFIYRDILGFNSSRDEKILNLALPLGVSFMTFTLAAYVFDIYRYKFSSQQRFSSVLGYVLFFPHLIAGPILRPNELIPQLTRPRTHIPLSIAAVAIFTLGLVKKLVFADTMGTTVDAIYAAQSISGPEALLAIYGFSIQIYCDFSGYTDMAIGLALLLGVRFPVNFKQPYCATSLVDFWRRWHITLSFWLRDYLYVPLGGNRCGKIRHIANIMITMVLGGLWHGASWNFVIWGFLQALGVSAAHIFRNVTRITPPRWLMILATFHFVTFAWIFFRAPTFEKAVQMLSAPFTGSWANTGSIFSSHIFLIVLSFIFFALHKFDDYRRIKIAVRRIRLEIVGAMILCGWLLALAISQGNSAKFIYFDF